MISHTIIRLTLKELGDSLKGICLISDSIKTLTKFEPTIEPAGGGYAIEDKICKLIKA